MSVRKRPAGVSIERNILRGTYCSITIIPNKKSSKWWRKWTWEAELCKCRRMQCLRKQTTNPHKPKGYFVAERNAAKRDARVFLSEHRNLHGFVQSECHLTRLGFGISTQIHPLHLISLQENNKNWKPHIKRKVAMLMLDPRCIWLLEDNDTQRKAFHSCTLYPEWVMMSLFIHRFIEVIMSASLVANLRFVSLQMPLRSSVRSGFLMWYMLLNTLT